MPHNDARGCLQEFAVCAGMHGLDLEQAASGGGGSHANHTRSGSGAESFRRSALGIVPVQ